MPKQARSARLGESICGGLTPWRRLAKTQGVSTDAVGSTERPHPEAVAY